MTSPPVARSILTACSAVTCVRPASHCETNPWLTPIRRAKAVCVFSGLSNHSFNVMIGILGGLILRVNRRPNGACSCRRYTFSYRGELDEWASESHATLPSKTMQNILRPASTVARLFPLVLAFLAMSALVAAGELDDAIKADCAAKWTSDYNMQKYCIGQQKESARDVNALMEKYKKGTEERKIIKRCAKKWKSENGYDFGMVMYCSRQQIQAYNELY